MLCHDITIESNNKSSNCVSEYLLKPHLLIFLQNISMMVDSSSSHVEKLFGNVHSLSTNYTGFSIDELGHMKLEKVLFSRKNLIKIKHYFYNGIFQANTFFALFRI